MDLMPQPGILRADFWRRWRMLDAACRDGHITLREMRESQDLAFAVYVRRAWRKSA